MARLRRRLRPRPLLAPTVSLLLGAAALYCAYFGSRSFTLGLPRGSAVAGSASAAAREQRRLVAVRVFKEGGRGPPPGEPDRKHRPYGDPFAVTIGDRVQPNKVKGRLGGKEAAPHLEALKSEDDEVRRAAAKALWKLSFPPASDGYRQYSSASGKEYFADASSEVYEALVQACCDDDWKVRWDASLAIGRLGLSDRWNTDPYIARLAMRLKRNTTDAEEKIYLAEALGRIGTPAQPYSRSIAPNLEHEDWRVRMAAIEAIGRLGPELVHHTSAIVQLKRDDIELVRDAAERCLFKIPIDKPGWMKVQNPVWRERIVKSNRGKRRKPKRVRM